MNFFSYEAFISKISNLIITDIITIDPDPNWAKIKDLDPN